MKDVFINQYLVGNGTQKEDAKDPPGALEHPTAKKALDAIASLQREKATYIQRHSKKSDFKRSSLWQIRKSDIGSAISKSTQSLFNRASYSAKLTEHFDAVNKHLADQVERKFAAEKRGLHAHKKADLIDDVQSLRKRVQALEAKLVSDAVSQAINMLSLDVRRKLGL